MVGWLEEKFRFVKYRAGSALVLVIVITVLLATVGVMFVMMSRLSQVATSAIADNRELSAAVDVVVNRIQTILVDDLFARAPAGFDLHLFAHPTPQLPPPDIGRPDYSEFDILNEPWDSPLSNWPIGFRLGDDPWLASLEPVEVPPNSGDYYWPHISDIYYDFLPPYLPAVIDPAYDANDFIIADADGDGVIDSRWIPLPVTSSKGRPLFAAVRIVDNCGMLNLNTAHTAAADSEGKYLSVVDYERFLRGSDATPGVPGDPDNIRRARMADGIFDPCDPCDSYQHYHDEVIMNIENPGPDYVLFDIGDELEIRNRYLLTSPVEARFERHDVANYTLDAGGGTYGALEIPRTTANFDRWKWRMDPGNFDGTSGGDPCDAYKYDRRHVCTFYSFDRNLRRRMYSLVDVINDTVDPNRIDWRLEVNPVFTPAPGVPVNISNDISSNSTESRRNILHLLYAFRAYFLDMDPDAGYQDAARRSAQLLANMIDYIDNYDGHTPGVVEGPFYDSDYGDQANENPTYIDRGIIRQLILDVSEYYFGIGNGIDIDDPAPGQSPYEFGLGLDDPDETVFGYERQPFISEIYRSYDSDAETEFFAIELCNPYLNPNGAISLNGWQIDIGGNTYDLSVTQVEQAPSAGQLGRLVIMSDALVPVFPGAPTLVDAILTIGPGNIVELHRPDPANSSEFITVDATKPEQTDFLLSPGDGEFVSKRDDMAWRFTDADSYTTDPCDTLGRENEASPIPPAQGYQMPVPNDNAGLATLHDFEMVLFIGNDPNAVTQTVGSATSEGSIRFDVASRPELLEYICFMNQSQGNLPGRININTATMEVIRAAIPPHPDWDPDADALANSIIASRQLPPIGNGPFERVSDLLDVPGFTQMMSDPNSGDPIIGDFEDRDWILSRVANIFTVRSDVFTAYILVRIGHDGPQKRMIAIFDRSNVFSSDVKPRLVALHPVPDPR